jgi:hypothetical protein
MARLKQVLNERRVAYEGAIKMWTIDKEKWAARAGKDKKHLSIEGDVEANKGGNVQVVDAEDVRVHDVNEEGKSRDMEKLRVDVEQLVEK